MKRLTNQTILALKGQEKRYDVPDEGGVPGLSIRVTPTGRKTWTFRYRTHLGKQRRITLGQFGNKTGVSLKEARDRARGILADVSKGEDPAKEKQDARKSEQARDIRTFEDLWLSYREGQGKAKRSAEYENELWTKKVNPTLGALDINELSKARINRLIRSIGDGGNGRPTTANRTHALMRQILNHGVALDYLTASPMAGLKMPYAENPRDKFLTDKEVATFWREIDGVSNLSPPVKIALKLSLLTGQRRAEVAHMTQQELNLPEKMWSLPKERTKNKRPHDVPLSDLAIELIQEAIAHAGYSDYIFPSATNKAKPISEKALTRAWSRARKQLELDDIRLHDFRRTCATGLQKLGVRLEVTEAILNHKSGSVSGIVAVYQRHDWKDEKREALDAWAGHLRCLNETTK